LRKKNHVDYKKLHEALKTGPLTYARIREITGLRNSSIMHVIDTLSLMYPLYQVRKGVYGLLKDDEDGEESDNGGPENQGGG
jgi:hypothetical protein